MVLSCNLQNPSLLPMERDDVQETHENCEADSEDLTSATCPSTPNSKLSRYMTVKFKNFKTDGTVNLVDELQSNGSYQRIIVTPASDHEAPGTLSPLPPQHCTQVSLCECWGPQVFISPRKDVINSVISPALRMGCFYSRDVRGGWRDVLKTHFAKAKNYVFISNRVESSEI